MFNILKAILRLLRIFCFFLRVFKVFKEEWLPCGIR